MSFSLFLSAVISGLTYTSFIFEVKFKVQKHQLRDWYLPGFFLDYRFALIVFVPFFMAILSFFANFLLFRIMETIGIPVQNVLFLSLVLTINGWVLTKLEKYSKNMTGALMFVSGFIILIFNPGLNHYIGG